MSSPSENATDNEKLWELYGDRQNESSREQLIVQYMPYAEQIARHLFSKRIYDDVEYEEYVQMAMTGLLESIDRYKPDSIASFKTFSCKRIKGAIYNGLNKLTEKREQNSYIYRKSKERLKSLNEQSNDTDLFTSVSDLTINIAIGFLLEESGMYLDSDRSAMEDRSYDIMVLDSLKRDILRMLDELPDVERKIIEYHYYCDSDFQEIADIIGLTKGRISQLHKNAIDEIRALLIKNCNYDQVF